jgi:hypothetical protein
VNTSRTVRAVLYVRVARPADDAAESAAQLARCLEYAEGQGWTATAEDADNNTTVAVSAWR